MAVRLEKEDKVRKITKLGGHSYAVTIPIEIIRDWEWQERQKVTLKFDHKNHKITIQDWVK